MPHCQVAIIKVAYIFGLKAPSFGPLFQIKCEILGIEYTASPHRAPIKKEGLFFRHKFLDLKKIRYYIL
jgi:hypothetical protein